MASNDEGQGSGDCDDAYRATDEFFSLTDDQPMLLLGPPVALGTEMWRPVFRVLISQKMAFVLTSHRITVS